MRREEILAGIACVAAEQLDWRGTLEPQARLVEDLGLDSVRLLTLAVEVENHFRICLDPEVETQIVTIDDLVEAVGEQLRGRSRGDA